MYEGNKLSYADKGRGNVEDRSGEDLVNGKILYENENRTIIWLGWDDAEDDPAVQTNQYLIISDGRGVLLDPGGVHLFSRVVASVSHHIELDKIDYIIFSHQDPDVSSGIALWLGITSAKIFISELWVRFMPHFGIVDENRINGIPDPGMEITIGKHGQIRCVPAHFLHSPGNFSIWDKESKILFSGDIGTAVFDKDGRYLLVKEFSEHVELCRLFHQRYMTSNEACRRWVETVKKLDIEMIAPQHGAIFDHTTARHFLDWLETLRCGVDLLETGKV